MYNCLCISDGVNFQSFHCFLTSKISFFSSSQSLNVFINSQPIASTTQYHPLEIIISVHGIILTIAGDCSSFHGEVYL